MVKPRRTQRPISAKQKEENRLALKLGGWALTGILCFALLYFLNKGPDLNPENGCPTSDPRPSAHTVVIVDQTDKFSISQINYAKQIILLEYERLHQGEKFTVIGLEEDPTALSRTFSRCRIKRGKDISGLVSNPQMVEAEFDRIVGTQLNEFVDGLKNSPQSDSSPIFETVEMMLDEPDFNSSETKRRIVIVSDMVQHSPKVSHYTNEAESWRRLPSRFRELDFTQSEVRIHYLKRPSLNSIQGASHKNHWVNFFKNRHADVRIGWSLDLVDLPIRRSSNISNLTTEKSEPDEIEDVAAPNEGRQTIETEVSQAKTNATKIREVPNSNLQDFTVPASKSTPKTPNAQQTTSKQKPNAEFERRLKQMTSQPQLPNHGVTETATRAQETSNGQHTNKPTVFCTEGSRTARLVRGFNVDRAYPQRAIEREQEGSVTAILIIDARGSVGRVNITSSNPPGVFDEAFLREASRLQFAPARNECENVAGTYQLTVQFRLD